MTDSHDVWPRVSTGTAGADDVLGGGFPAHRLYLVNGTPGVGKTTFALQFLLDGARRKERVLYITLSETEEEIRQVAQSHGWNLDGIAMVELSSAEQTLRLEDQNTLFVTSDVELKETMRVLLAEVDRVKPERVVFDSLSEIRLLAQTPQRYRRQLLALKQFFIGRKCTALLLDDHTSGEQDDQVASLAHGVVDLEMVPVSYGAERRRMRVTKLRGSSFRSGHHDFAIRSGGLVVFPRLVSSEHRTAYQPEPVASGVPGLDRLLGGGIERGCATLIMGPAGTGKSVLATQIACSFAESGGRAAMFVFEERIATMLARTREIGMPLGSMMEAGRIRTHQLDPAELSPDEFTHEVRREVEAGARLLVIDSLTGYVNAMPDVRFLTLQLHELLAYLAEQGVATILTLALGGIMSARSAPVMDASYLADTVVLLRYFEASGHVRKAVSVMKKRTGSHENTIRELTVGRDGLRLSEPLTSLRGVFTGVPIPERDQARDDR